MATVPADIPQSLKNALDEEVVRTGDPVSHLILACAGAGGEAAGGGGPIHRCG